MSCSGKKEKPENYFIHYLPQNPAIQLTGRFFSEKKGEVSCAYGKSTIRFAVDASEVTLAFKNISPNDSKYNENFIQIIIDSSSNQVLKLKNGLHYYKIRFPKAGYHLVEVVKRTEAACGIIIFKGIYLKKNSRLVNPLPLPVFRLEFIGNSITCGYGNEDKDGSVKFLPSKENANATFASFAATKLNAQCVTICFSGKGIYRNYAGDTFETLPFYYNRIYPQNPRKWDFSNYQPDFVIIDLGTNDFASGIPDSVSFVRCYTNFCIEIHKKNPSAGIILLDGPVMSNNWPVDDSTGFSLKKLSILKNYLNSVKNSYAVSTGSKRIYRFSLSTQGKLGYGANWHPNVAQHKLNGDELADFIMTIRKN